MNKMFSEYKGSNKSLAKLQQIQRLVDQNEIPVELGTYMKNKIEDGNAYLIPYREILCNNGINPAYPQEVINPNVRGRPRKIRPRKTYDINYVPTGPLMLNTTGTLVPDAIFTNVPLQGTILGPGYTVPPTALQSLEREYELNTVPGTMGKYEVNTYQPPIPRGSIFPQGNPYITQQEEFLRQPQLQTLIPQTPYYQDFGALQNPYQGFAPPVPNYLEQPNYYDPYGNATAPPIDYEGLFNQFGQGAGRRRKKPVKHRSVGRPCKSRGGYGPRVRSAYMKGLSSRSASVPYTYL